MPESCPYEFPEEVVRELHHTLNISGMTIALADVVQALRGFSLGIQAATAAMEAWSRAQWASLTQVYLTEHRCLPGSTRTARLRKKRYQRVLRWSEQHPPQEP